MPENLAVNRMGAYSTGQAHGAFRRAGSAVPAGTPETGRPETRRSSTGNRVQTLFVVDDDELIRETIRSLLSTRHLLVRVFPNAPAFLEQADIESGDCLITDIRMPQMSGIELQRELSLRGVTMPVIVLTGYGDVPLAVEAMKAGAFDFLQKPFNEKTLRGSVARALASARREKAGREKEQAAQNLVECLTGRERQVFELLVKGEANKIIAHLLGISPRTVEAHRARVQEKLQASCLADLVRIARAAGSNILATN